MAHQHCPGDGWREANTCLKTAIFCIFNNLSLSFSLSLSLSVCVCVRACMCVCVCACVCYVTHNKKGTTAAQIAAITQKAILRLTLTPLTSPVD